MNENPKMNDLPLEERPIERLICYGSEILSNTELLAIILRTGTKGENVITLCQRVLKVIGGIDNLQQVSFEKITKIKGIKNVKGAQIIAVCELYKRMNTLKCNNMKITVDSPKSIGNMLVKEMRGLKQEVLKLIVLNTKNKIIKVKDVFKGGLNTSVAHPREIYSEAIKCNGSAIIICHNHPSGDPTPSKEDINISKRIQECGKIIGIELLDHIITGDNEYISLKEKGII